MTDLAYVLQGETGGLLCGGEAMLIIFGMIRRGAGPWYGYAEPGRTAAMIARYGWQLPDPLPDAWYAFSAEDLKLARVQAIIGNRKSLRVIQCNGGLSLSFYGRN